MWEHVLVPLVESLAFVLIYYFRQLSQLSPSEKVPNLIFQILTFLSWVPRVPMEAIVLIFILASILKFLMPVYHALVPNLHSECFLGHNQGCIGTKVWANVAWTPPLSFSSLQSLLGHLFFYGLGLSLTLGGDLGFSWVGRSLNLLLWAISSMLRYVLTNRVAFAYVIGKSFAFSLQRDPWRRAWCSALKSLGFFYY